MKSIRITLSAAVALLIVLVGIGYLGFVHPAFDSFAHFRLHGAAALVVGGSLVAMLRGTRTASVGLLIALFAISTTLWPLWSGIAANAGATLPYRFVQMNLRFDVADTKAALRTIAHSNADIVALEEATDRWLAELATIKSAYPYQRKCMAAGRVGGVAIISRRPFQDHPANTCGGASGLMIQAINMNGRTLLAGAIHLHWPWPNRQAQQIGSMEKLLENIRQSNLPIILGGDMNAAYWSHAMRRISSGSGTHVLPYMGGSWAPIEMPAGFAAWAGLAIDNILVKDVEVGNVQKLEHTASDHLPLMIEFSMPAPQVKSPDSPDLST